MQTEESVAIYPKLTSAFAMRRYAILCVHAYRCRHCGELAEQVDHIIPQRSGGSDEPENLVPLCGPCNALKNKHHLVHGVLLDWRADAQIAAPLVREIEFAMKHGMARARSVRTKHLLMAA